MSPETQYILNENSQYLQIFMQRYEAVSAYIVSDYVFIDTNDKGGHQLMSQAHADGLYPGLFVAIATEEALTGSPTNDGTLGGDGAFGGDSNTSLETNSNEVASTSTPTVGGKRLRRQ